MLQWFHTLCIFFAHIENLKEWTGHGYLCSARSQNRCKLSHTHSGLRAPLGPSKVQSSAQPMTLPGHYNSYLWYSCKIHQEITGYRGYFPEPYTFPQPTWEPYRSLYRPQIDLAIRFHEKLWKKTIFFVEKTWFFQFTKWDIVVGVYT